MSHFVQIPINKHSLANRKLLYGKGVNNAPYQTYPTISGKRIRCPHHRAWSAMLERCYSKKWQNKYPTYLGYSVCNEWHSFMTFRKWMLTQDWKNNQLDKDLLDNPNKVYSPTTCLFISQHMNKLLTNHAAARGNYPIGVTKHKGRYVTQLSIDGKNKHLGQYATVEEASAAYREAKAKEITRHALLQSDPLKAALLVHANRFLTNVPV